MMTEPAQSPREVRFEGREFTPKYDGKGTFTGTPFHTWNRLRCVFVDGQKGYEPTGGATHVLNMAARGQAAPATPEQALEALRTYGKVWICTPQTMATDKMVLYAIGGKGDSYGIRKGGRGSTMSAAQFLSRIRSVSWIITETPMDEPDADQDEFSRPFQFAYRR